MRRLVVESVSYQISKPKMTIINQVTVEFLPGKVYHVLGGPQSGKSTLLSLLAGLEICTEGTIYFDEVDLAKIDREAYRAENVVCLFESGNLVKDTPLANLELAALLAGQPVKSSELKKILLATGLTPQQIKTPITKLSKEDQQLVLFAKIMASESKLVLIDEPEQLFSEWLETDLLQKLTDFCRKKEKCLIIASQGKQTIKFADELWGLNGGKLLFIKEQQID